MNREELYDTLVRTCQAQGFTTDATYESLHSAVDSLRVDDPEEESIQEGGPLAKYRVEVTTIASVSAVVEVEAVSEQAAGAKAKAMAKSGDVVWVYDGADDSAVEVEMVMEALHA